MSGSQRWPIVFGAFAVLLCGALAAVGSLMTDPSHPTSCARLPVPSVEPSSLPPQPGVSAAVPGFLSGRRQTSLEANVRPLLRDPRLRTGVFGVDLASGSFFDLLGAESFAAASLIKIPIVVALFAQVDRGSVALDERIPMRSEQVAAGSGHIQYQPVGTVFTVRRLAELTIRKSDNTATNMLIDRLGGIDAVNRVFATWGLSRTVLRAPLPDMDGTNRTSPRDLVAILGQAAVGGLLERGSRDLLLSWMQRTHVRSLLPSGVGAGSRVANKTGDIPGALGDAGYVETPDGHRYLLAVQVERPRNSARAKELIRGVSRVVYRAITGRTPGPAVFPGRSPAASNRRRSPGALTRRPS